MCDKIIYLDAPNIGEQEKNLLCKAVDSGYVSTIGPFVSEFEAQFARYMKTDSAVAVQSGTAAIHMALHELGIGEGDEIIVPALTFVASVNPVKYVGATPVFVDVDLETWNMDPIQIENSITENTKAIIIVHLYGNPCNIEEILKITQKYGIYLIEDATESLGSRYKKRYTGTFGDFGCFSFNGNKTITTGGGGMIIGKDNQRLEHIKFLINQARDSSKGYYHPETGFNYRMTNIAASLGLAQMGKLDNFLEKKKIFNKIYKDRLSQKNFKFQKEYEYSESSCWLNTALIDKNINIPKLQKKLLKMGIQTRRIFMPLTEFPPYKENDRKKYRNSYYIYENGLCLASSTLNSEDDIVYVCDCIKHIMK